MRLTARTVGLAALAAFVGTVFAANWAVDRWGGVSVGFGLVAPAAVYFVGLAFTLRDLVQRFLGRWWAFAGILAGAALSYVVNPDIAKASAVAFLVSETADLAVFTLLGGERADGARFAGAVLVSNAVALVVDSAVFLELAFDSLEFFRGQVVGKAWMTLAALPVVLLLRRWEPRLAAAAILLLFGGCGGAQSDPDEPDLSVPVAMTLRLSDLPQGFRYGDDRGCGEVATTEGDEPKLDEFLLETRPRACLVEFAREWGGPPPVVQTALVLFDSDEDARRAWELRKPLFESFASIFLTTERGAGEAVAFDSEGLQRRGAGEAWRDDRLVVAVYEEGLSGEDGREFAGELAEKQRQRIESPSSPQVEDDREIGLEDPAIAIPVYWLGREFESEGLPSLELEGGDHLRGGGPGNEVKIDYSGEGSGVTLDLWKPDAWSRFKRTRLGRIAWSVPCARRTEVQVEGGTAQIYGGYTKGCQGEPDHWLAHVYYDEVVVAVNMAYCYGCGGRSADDPYNSREGMEAVVRGLKRR
jgi:uncharacterized PurR-regulated membrane protein YhhQ (DUF165 family)